MAGRLEGKIAFVTGAGGGIGTEICRLFIAEGARVLAGDVTLEVARAAAQASGGDRILPVALDVTEGESVRAGLARAAEALGRIDVLCNVAGGSTPHDARVTEAPEEEFRRAIKLDLFSTFLVCKYGILSAEGRRRVGHQLLVHGGDHGADRPRLRHGGEGRGPRPDPLDGAGMRARPHPGERHRPRPHALRPGAPPDRRTPRAAQAGRPVPARPLRARRQAHVAVYLASDESRHTTGQVIPVDSGVTIY